MTSSRIVFAMGPMVVSLIVGCGSGAQMMPADASGSGDRADNVSPVSDGGDDSGSVAEPGRDAASGDAPPTDAGSGSGDARVDAPLVNPTINQLTPSSLPVGTTGSFTLVIDGRDWPPNPLISFDGNVWSAQINSPTQLQASIPSQALGVTPRRVQVQVTRIADPPLDSNILYFEVTPRDGATGN